MREGNLKGILDASILHAGMEALLGEVAELGRMCLAASGEDRPSMTEVADKLKALRSTWKEKLVMEHTAIERSFMHFSPSASAPWDPPSSSMYVTVPHMTGIGVETPR